MFDGVEQIGESKAAEAIKSAALANVRDPEYHAKPLDVLVEQACAFVNGARGGG